MNVSVVISKHVVWSKRLMSNIDELIELRVNN